jgi:hypothetical protein
MTLQYLKDDYNNTTAVVIPISDWEKITRTHQDINLMLDIKKDNPKKLKPSDFRGCISSQTADNLNAHIEQSRTEWNNNI